MNSEETVVTKRLPHFGVVNYSISVVLNSQQNGPKVPTTTVPKKEILVLSYLWLQSIRITKQLKERLALINFMDSLISGLFFKASIVVKFQRLFISGIRSVVGTVRNST